MLLKKLESGLDEVAKIRLLALRIVDAVTLVQIFLLEQVHDRQDLAIVRYKSLTNRITAKDKRLKDVQGSCDNFSVARVQSHFDRDDELRNNWQDLGLTVLEEIEHSLNCQEAVWLLFLADTFHEDGQVMVIVQLFHFNLPLDRVTW